MVTVAALALALSFAASFDTSNAAAAPAATAPKDLLLVATVPSIDGPVADAAAYADHVSPGAGANLLTLTRQWLSMVQGVDPHAAAALFVLDAGGGKAPEAGVVMNLADVKAFQATLPASVSAKLHGSWAVVGDAATVDRAGEWALQALADAKVPPHLAVTVEPTTLLAAHRADLERFTQQMGSAMASSGTTSFTEIVDAMMSGLTAMLEQSQRIEVALKVSAMNASFEIALVPRPKTVLAQVMKAQVPSTFELLPRLPADGLNMVAAGRIAAGPLRPTMWRWMEKLMGIPLNAPGLGDQAKTLVALLDGEIAMTMLLAPSNPRLTALYKMRNNKRGGTLLQQLADSVRKRGAWTTELMGIKTRYQIVDVAPVESIGFVELDTTYDYSAAPSIPRAMHSAPMKALWGAWDDVLGFATVGDAEALVKSTRQPRALPPQLAEFVADAKTRKASFLEIIDFIAASKAMSAMPAGTMTGSAPMAMWLGFAGGRTSFGIDVPAASVGALVKATAAAKMPAPPSAKPARGPAAPGKAAPAKPAPTPATPAVPAPKKP
jgi:hypothetical protein